MHSRSHARSTAGRSGKRSKSWEDAPNAHALRESGWKRGSSQSSASIRVRTKIFKQGTRPAFSFTFVALEKGNLPQRARCKALIPFASQLKSLYLLTL